MVREGGGHANAEGLARGRIEHPDPAAAKRLSRSSAIARSREAALGLILAAPPIITLVALIVLHRTAKPRSWALVYCIVVFTAGPMLAMDIIFGGHRSANSRYLVPLFICTFGNILGHPYAEVKAYYSHPFPAIVAGLTIVVALKHFASGAQMMIEDYAAGTTRHALVIGAVCLSYAAIATGLFALVRLAL